MKAIWNDTVIAQSNNTIVIEGNHYFPVDTIKSEYFRASETHTVCHWKGEASYFDIAIGDDINKDAAWYYPNPKELASSIKNYVAFWKGVNVVE